MIYKNREHAGKTLASLLSAYRNKPDTIVLGLARGGMVVAFEIAKALELPLNLLIPRKITGPSNPELALGAVAEDGEVLLNQPLIEQVGVSSKEIKEAIQKAKKEILERTHTYRRRNPLENLEGKTVILVDDGIATGFTMLAEIQSLKKKKAHKIVVAVPVSSSRAWREIEASSDEAVCPQSRDDFFGISEFYADFAQIDDKTVLSLLRNL